MKTKYFLRGLGAGILFTTLLLFGMYSYKMSDSRIIERARELGMEYSRGSNSETEPSKNPPQTGGSTEETTTPKAEQTTTSPQPSSPSNQPSGSSNQSTSSSQDSIEVSISSGMNSESVSEMLERAGVIDNADDFNQYLVDNNIGRYIRSGEYQLKSKMSYEEIAQALRTGR